MISMVLGTDMGLHFEELSKFKNLVDSPEFLVGKKSEEDKSSEEGSPKLSKEQFDYMN